MEYTPHGVLNITASNITNSNEYEDVVDKVTVIDSNVSTLQSYTASNRTNFAVGPNVFQDLTTGTQNTAIGNGAGGGPYMVTSGSSFPLQEHITWSLR